MDKHHTADATWDALFADLKKDIAISEPASLLLFAALDLNIGNLIRIPNTVYISSSDDLNRYIGSSPADRKFDLAILIFDAEDIKNDIYMHLISRLRDTDCARVYSACRVPPTVMGEQYDACFRALGFKLLNIYNEQMPDKMSIHLYYYDIYDYKEVPDWFSNRFWAHPNMWNKARW